MLILPCKENSSYNIPNKQNTIDKIYKEYILQNTNTITDKKYRNNTGFRKYRLKKSVKP